MGSISNPMINSLVPGGNPTGVNISLPNAFGSNTTGSNPLLPSVSPSPNTSGTTNPYTSAPNFPANGPGATNLTTPLPGGPTTNVAQAAQSNIGGANLLSSTDISRLFNSLKSTYGDGPAHAILNFLTSGAGFNQQAIDNLFASMQPQIERGTESLMEQFSSLGDRFGSGAQIGLGDYLSQVNLNEGQLETQMYEQAIQNYMDVLMGTSSANAQRKASSPGLLDSITGALGLGGSAAGGLSSIISGISPNADTGILDAIAGGLAF